MKKKIVCITLVAIAVASGYMGFRTQKSCSSAMIAYQLVDIEALASCENPDGALPNGYCRSDDYNNKFCGSSHWLFSDDCVQQK